MSTATQFPTQAPRNGGPIPVSFLARIAALAGAAVPLAAAEIPWPEFRGPSGDGIVPPHADGAPRSLPVEWSESSANIAWKTEVAGRAWSTPAIAEGRVWLTNANEDGTRMSVVALDLESGARLHDQLLFSNDSPEPLGNPVNGYGSPSPVAEPGRVFVHFGSYGTACLDSSTAEVVWERRDLPCRHYRGPGSSPISWKETLILTMDGIDHQYLVALDKRTGRTLWKTDRTTEWNDLDEDGKPIAEGDLRKAYSTPLVVALPDGGHQLVSCGAKSAFAYDPDTGREIWKVTYDGFSNASRPVAGNGFVYINSGFGKANLLAVRLDPEARGDITGSHVTWEMSKRAPLKPSPLCLGELLFFVNDGGVATCLDALTGEEIWSERLGGKFSGSPIASGSRIWCSNEQGESFVFAATRRFELLGTGKLESGAMASPAVAGNDLILRTTTHVYRIRGGS